jgi:thiol-disulfide isomerase/thioredoxin
MKVMMNKILIFTAPWCSPCKAVLKEMDVLIKKYSDQIQVIDGTVPENINLVKKYHISRTPTMVFLQNDVEYSFGGIKVSMEHLEMWLTGHDKN